MAGNVKVGSAYAEMGLQYTGLQKGVEVSIGLLKQLEEQADAFTKKFKDLALTPRATGPQRSPEEDAQRKAQAELEKQERTQRQVAQASIRLALAEKDYGKALNLIQSELAAVNPSTARYINLQAQLVRVQQQANQGAQGFGSRLQGSIQQGLPFGIGAGAGFAATQIALAGLR